MYFKGFKKILICVSWNIYFNRINVDSWVHVEHIIFYGVGREEKNKNKNNTDRSGLNINRKKAATKK